MVFEYKSLYITNESDKAEKARKEGRYVILLLPLIGEIPDMSAYPYAIENMDEVSSEYLDRLILRFENKPWLILETQRCRVREITPEDVDALYEIYADKEITAYMEDLYETKEEEIAYTKDYISCHYRFYEFGMWIIEDKFSGRILGRAGLDMVEGKETPQLGFVVRKDLQKQGIATEVCQAILKYANDTLGLKHLEATCDERNAASVSLLKKLGFKPAGVALGTMTWRI